MRRIILAGLALVAAATVFDIPAADAQVSSGRNPWCIRDGVGGPGSWDCSYHNLAQCMASASGAGGWLHHQPELHRRPRTPDEEPAPRQYLGRRHLGLGRRRAGSARVCDPPVVFGGSRSREFVAARDSRRGRNELANRSLRDSNADMSRSGATARAIATILLSEYALPQTRFTRLDALWAKFKSKVTRGEL